MTGPGVPKTDPATNGWSVDATGVPTPLLRTCLEAAIAAPSIHNTQPWRFRPHGQVVDVLVDHGRQLTVLDPSGRELFISVGAAILNLRVALLAHGHTPVLQLLPDPADSNLAARVSAGAPVAPADTARLLAQAIPHRRTNRRPFSTIPVPPEVLSDLVAAAQVEGAVLTEADPPTRDAVLSVVRTAEHRWRADPAYRNELRRWTRDAPHRRDGVPPEAYGPWDALEVVPVRDFGIAAPPSLTPGHGRRTGTFENEPTIAVIYTVGDGPLEWLRAGMALERVLLTATVRGLANTLMTQPLEIPGLRALLADSAHGRTAQAIVRFGYGQPSPPSPRRSVTDVLITPTLTTPAPAAYRSRDGGSS